MIDKNRYDLSLIASGKIEGSFAERMPDIHLIHLDTGFEKASISDVFRNTDMLATNRAGKNYNVQMKSRWSNKEDICFECCGYKGTIKENAIYGTYYSKKYKSYIWPNFKDMDMKRIVLLPLFAILFSCGGTSNKFENTISDYVQTNNRGTKLDMNFKAEKLMKFAM